MNRIARSTTVIIGACLLAVAAGVVPAMAQDLASGGQAPRPPRQQGPLVVQPVESGWVFAPEVRFTDLNHSWGTQMGIGGGYLYDDTFYFGGAMYWMVGGANSQTLNYGGFVTGWNTKLADNVHVGVRGLFGWGHSETYETWTDPGYCHHGTCYPTTTQTGWVYQDFMVFEPSVTATFKIGKQVSLEAAGGYRLTGNGYYGWDNHANGAFASVGVRLGVF